jgi:hypothetical protein
VTQTSENKDCPTYSQVELLISGNGLALKEMVMEFSNGQTMPNMKVNGVKIKHVAMASFGMPMVIILMGIGKMIKQMVLECICIKMEPNTRAAGVMIYKKGTELKLGK